MAGLSLRDRVRGSDMQRELGVEPLLLHIQRSQLKWVGIWVGCLLDVSFWRFSRQVQLGGARGADPELAEGLHLACKQLRIPQEELESVARVKDV